MISNIPKVFAGIFGFALLSACSTTANVNHFKQFAQAGSQYQYAVAGVTDIAIASNIDTNSLALIRFRADNQGKDILEDQVITQNERLTDTTEAFLALKQQTSLMADYFYALGALANYDGASGLAASAQGTVQSIQALSPKLQNISIGNAGVADFVGALVPIAVAQFQSRSLTQELKANASVIDNQLRLQAIFLEDVAAQLRADNKIITNLQMNDFIILPYGDNGALPDEWMELRRDLVMGSLNSATAADHAVILSKKLRTSFISLVEGRLDVGDLGLIASDLNQMTNLLNLVLSDP